MPQFARMFRAPIAGVVAVAVFVWPAWALVIVPTFDGSLTGSSNAAALESAIDTAANTIDSLYGNPGTVQILFEFNKAVHGESSQGTSTIGYSGVYTGQTASPAGYVATLAHDAAGHPGNTVLATSLAHISSGNQPSLVQGTSALFRVGLGLTGAGTTPCYNASGVYVSGCGQVYDGVVAIGNLSTSPNGPGINSDAVSVVENEIDNVLGGGAAGSSLGSGGPSSIMGPTDLYRYQSVGPNCASVDSAPSFTTSAGAVSCYSIDGGNTALVQMNQAGSGSFFGDFAFAGTSEIQDAFDSGPTRIYGDTSPEFTMMESIGYNAFVPSAPVPEPSTLVLVASAVAGIAGLRFRGVRRAMDWAR